MHSKLVNNLLQQLKLQTLTTRREPQHYGCKPTLWKEEES